MKFEWVRLDGTNNTERTDAANLPTGLLIRTVERGVDGQGGFVYATAIAFAWGLRVDPVTKEIELKGE